MMDDALHVEDEPRLEEVAALDDLLYRHNAAVTGYDDGRWLAIFVRDGAGVGYRGVQGSADVLVQVAEEPENLGSTYVVE